LLDILAPQDSEWTQDPVQAVHAVLANRVGRWLLVLDDIADPDDRDTLLARANLARWTARTEDVAQARKMCTELLEGTVRILGLDDKETRVTGAALAYWTGKADDSVQAQEVYAAVVRRGTSTRSQSLGAPARPSGPSLLGQKNRPERRRTVDPELPSHLRPATGVSTRGSRTPTEIVILWPPNPRWMSPLGNRGLSWRRSTPLVHWQYETKCRKR